MIFSAPVRRGVRAGECWNSHAERRGVMCVRNCPRRTAHSPPDGSGGSSGTRGRLPELFEGSPVRRSPGKGLPEARGARTAGRRVRQRAPARGGLPHRSWPVPVGSGGAVLPFRGRRARSCQASSERQGRVEAREFALRGRCHVRRTPAPADGVGAAGRAVARRVRAGLPGSPTVALLVLAPVRQRPDPFAAYRPAGREVSRSFRPAGVPVPKCVKARRGSGI